MSIFIEIATQHLHNSFPVNINRVYIYIYYLVYSVFMYSKYSVTTGYDSSTEHT